MKKLSKFFVSLLCAALIALMAMPMLAACGEEDTPGEVDYASSLTLDFTSPTKKQEVKVRLYVDGDTTHFNPVTDSTLTDYNAADFEKTYGYIKARYLAVNTPESTGDIEKWGKTASDFTRKQLESAESIVVESDDGNWNLDTTNERYLLWIWYKPQGATQFRNLNIELLQYGYGRSSSSGDNRYGETALAALAQAQAQKLRCFSPASTKDPNFFDDDAVQLSLKALRFRVDEYVNKAVRVEGIVTARFGNTAYIEEYDEETKTSYGMAVYYGFQMGSILDVLQVGNRVSVHGKVSYYEAGDTYQISDVENNEFRPTSKTNTFVVGEEAVEPPFTEMNATDIIDAGRELEYQFEVEVDGEEKLETRKLDYREAIMGTSVTLKGLKVIETYTTADGTSEGAMSLTCQIPGSTKTITIRTQVIKDEQGNLITADKYNQKTIDVKGIVGKFKGEYQVNVHRADYITVL